MSLTRHARSYPVHFTRHAKSDEAFGRFGRHFGAFGHAVEDTGMDLYETEDALVLELAVPGLTAEAIDVSVEGRRLKVRADLPAADEDEGRRYFMRSLPRGRFARTVRLPSSVDTEAIEAQVQAGLLTLRMPKAVTAKARKIEIANS